MKKILDNLFWSLLPKKVYGLVGASGTGKSFRAYLIAEKYKIQYLIDDGLLIKGHKIIAGKSAKKETLRVTAIKRAIFHETKHAREVRKKLYRENYRSVMVIATSDGMLYKIIKRLHLPKPTKIIRIEDVATEEEIKKARKSRKKHGKHVIPIPLIEVKKKYPGIVSTAIHFFIDDNGGFFRKKKNKIIEKTIVRPKYGNNGNITISEAALVQMISHCVDEYSKSIQILKIKINEREEGYYFYLKIAIDYHMDNAELVKTIQDLIKNKIEGFTGIEIKKIDINISQIISSKVSR